MMSSGMSIPPTSNLGDAKVLAEPAQVQLVSDQVVQGVLKSVGQQLLLKVDRNEARAGVYGFEAGLRIGSKRGCHYDA